MLKLWFSCLPEPVIPPEMYDAFLRTQRHRSPEARVAGIHAMLRQCEHRVLQVLYPLMEVRVSARSRAGVAPPSAVRACSPFQSTRAMPQ